MSSEQVERNIATFRRQQEDVLAGGNMDIMESIFAPGFVRHRSGMGHITKAAGIVQYRPELDVYERQRQGFGVMLKTFPHQERIIHQVFGQGDLVAARWTIRTAFEGPLLGFPPTGQAIDLEEFGIIRYDDNARMVEAWFILDELGMLEELGLLKIPVREGADGSALVSGVRREPSQLKVVDAPGTQIERNIATFRRQQEDVLAGGNMDIMESIFAPGFVRHRSGMGHITKAAGIVQYRPDLDVYERQRQGFGVMLETFPHQERIIHQAFGQGDLVAARWTIRTAFEGPLLGFPPTGQAIDLEEFGIIRYDDDARMVEAWFILDELGMLEELGLLKIPVAETVG